MMKTPDLRTNKNYPFTIQLKKSLSAWGTPEFNLILKMELEGLDVDQLPLQQGLSSSSFALDDNLSVIIMSSSLRTDIIAVKAGIFYSGLIAGCNCADDPSPDSNEQNEYCEIQLQIDRATGEASVSLIPT